ncbi:O-antigen ligase family protein [Streptomyces sp. MK7]|uniref:O-antigen ligase family protein n=1 Tax=Streptomyces sp. MK7 TaxID=3067635 RepID=UPI00292DB005|nr:O-antigen ligase family protein [Streptomyces sp. MK7]
MAVLLGGGRWASHIAVGPVYITDVLLAGTWLHAIAAHRLRRRTTRRSRPTLHLVGLAVLLTLVRLLTFEGEPEAVARDAAPFLYMAVAYLSAPSFACAGNASRRRTFRILYGALVVHFGWVALLILAPGFSSNLSTSGGMPLLALRPDFDTALLGVLTGVSILRFRAKDGNWLNVALAVASLALALTMHSRAGLLACSACVLAGLAGRLSGNGRTTVRTLASGVTVVLALLTLLPNSPAGQRLIAGLDSTAYSQEITLNAQGTSNGRKVAWSRTVNYAFADPVRGLVGVGFGPDFLRSSGADIALGSDRFEGVRSPHNYALTVLARLGTVGLVVIASLLIVIVSAATRELCTRRGTEPLSALCVLLVLAIFIASMLGVILESPFGAVPFFWAGGILLAFRPPGHGRKGAWDTRCGGVRQLQGGLR